MAANVEKAYMPCFKINNLHSNNESINSIQVKSVDEITKLLFSCCDEEILIYNLNNSTKTQLYRSADSDDINQLKLPKLNNSSYLLSTNGQFVYLFDINSVKQLLRLKASKDSINCIELDHDETLVACGDDLGEVKILDFRIANNSNASNVPITLANKKAFKKHENICYTLKFNPSNNHELFSGSYDSSIIKWDLRAPNQQLACLNQTSVSSLLNDIKQKASLESNTENEFISTMTPCFVHSLHLTSVNIEGNNTPILLAGIENGLCLAFNATTCEYLFSKQLKQLNCALTQLTSISKTQLNSKFQTYLNLTNANEILISTGNDLNIEFFYLNNKNSVESGLNSRIKIEQLNKFKIKHGLKINYTLAHENNLYICDTSENLSIYNMDVLCRQDNLTDALSRCEISSK